MRRLFVFLLLALGVVVNLSYAQAETTVRVSEISFVGNHKFTSAQLKEQLATRENESIDIDQRKRLFERDVEKLNYFYLKEGFAQAKVRPPEILFESDKKTAHLVFNLSEGDRFKMGKVRFAGEWPGVTPAELLAATQLHKQPFFNYQILQEDLKVLEGKCGDQFHPLPRTRILEAERKVDVTFELVRTKM